MAAFAAPNVLGNLQSLYFNAPAPTELTARKPSVSERIQDGVANVLGRLGYNERHANDVARRAASAITDLTPVGAAQSAEDAGNDYRSGNYLGAAGNALASLLSAMPDGGSAVMHSIIAPLFHGSPHAFEKFALEKIGTGEGAQAYGHGLYFAENPQVAKEYQQQLSGTSVRMPDGSIINPSAMPFATSQDQTQRAAAQLLAQHGGAKAAKRATTSASIMDAIDNLVRQGAAPVGNGHLYEVQLDANPEDFLDYDKPIGAQSEKIQQAVSDRPTYRGVPIQDVTGDRAYSAMGHLINDNPSLVGDKFYTQSLGANMSDLLRKRGISGIRYLDQGSRNMLGNLTHNYVVFDPSIIDILARH